MYILLEHTHTYSFTFFHLHICLLVLRFVSMSYLIKNNLYINFQLTRTSIHKERVYVAECYMHLFIYFSLIFTVLTKSIVTCIYLLCPCVQGSMQLKSLSMFVSIHWSLCATSCFKSYLTKTYKI